MLHQPGLSGAGPSLGGLLAVVLLTLPVQGLKVDGREHKRGEAAAGQEVVGAFAQVGEQDRRAVDVVHLVEDFAGRAADKEDAGLLDLDHEGGLVVVGAGDGHLEDDLEVLLAKGLDFGRKLEVHLGLPILLEKSRGGRRFEGNIFNVEFL